MPKLKLFTPALIWVCIIFYLLVIPGKRIPKGGIFSIPNFDKFVHASLFGMQVLLAAVPFLKTKYRSKQLYFTIAAAAIVYGIVMEFVQKYFTADRAFDIWDMVADAFGAFTGAILLNLYSKREMRNRQPAA